MCPFVMNKTFGEIRHGLNEGYIFPLPLLCVLCASVFLSFETQRHREHRGGI